MNLLLVRASLGGSYGDMTTLEFWNLIERARTAVTKVQDIPGWLVEITPP